MEHWTPAGDNRDNHLGDTDNQLLLQLYEKCIKAENIW